MLQSTIRPVKVIGICDACDTEKKVETFKTPHGLFLCAVHYEAEQAAYKNAVVVKAIEIDSLVISKDSIFNASTLPMEEIRASIYQDDNIPEDGKLKTLAEVVSERIARFKREIFDDKVALKAKEEHLMMLSGNMASLISGLKESERAQYKQFEVNYQPPVVKKIKTVVGKTPKSVHASNGMSPQTRARAARDAASKYIGLAGSSVQATADSQPGMTYEQAADYLANLMKLPKKSA